MLICYPGALFAIPSGEDASLRLLLSASWSSQTETVALTGGQRDR